MILHDVLCFSLATSLATRFYIQGQYGFAFINATSAVLLWLLIIVQLRRDIE